jgi:histidine kinase/DNA gyrase B/HSP90-like ATPase
VKFPPKVSYLKSLRGDRVRYPVLVGEAIDNAFDANARHISIELGDNLVRFQDDGIGITRNRIESLFSLGDHGMMTSTQLGRFGIGIKTQAINAGDIFTVKSTSVDGCFWVQVNWRKVLASGEWEADDPTWLPFSVGSPTGTIIELSALRTPQKYTVEQIIEEMAQRFYPALIDGKTIKVNEKSIPVLADPKMTDVIEKIITLSKNRRAHLRAGILTEKSKLNRVHVSFRHRVIMPASSVGCGDYGGLTKMFARLQLAGVWHLGKYKDDLTDEDERDELETAVGEALEPILEKCNSASMDARIAALGELIHERLAPEIAAARPVRKQKTVESGEKRKRRPGIVDEPSHESGPAKTKRPQQGKLLITFEGKNEEDGIGSYQPGRTNRINLSADNPNIANFVHYRDQTLAADALVLIAFAIYEQGKQERAPELPLKSFGQRIADLLELNATALAKVQTS